MRIGSLFSGIGGLERGLEQSGLGHTVWQVESNKAARKVLAKHWPDAERFDDVCSVGAHNLSPVDLVCGGFPCQDVSSAGKRAGLEGDRSGLWYQFHRVVSELRPRWVVVENVTSGAAIWVDAVVAGLEQLGYKALPIPIEAANVGALHRRARVFIVAYADAHSEHALPVDAEVGLSPEPPSDADCAVVRLEPRRECGQGRAAREEVPSWAGGRFAEPDMVRVVHGAPRGVDSARVAMLGNSVVPQCAEVVGYVVRLLSGD